ncbi:hypothetical protein [uncultured Chryseobacterium sp.]|uniref:hypothetical protein n=1 Tax=uncultured Chryseobacterium sp. TaxID=259322 RepID=UPI003749DA00
MKKIIFLIIFVISYTNAQTYSFDYKIKFVNYKKNKNDLQDCFYFVNSQNPNYSMYLYHNKNGAIRDCDKNICNVHKFEYMQNYEFNKYRFINSFQYEVKDEITITKIIVEKIDDNKYTIKCFENESSKKTNLELTVILKPENSDLVRFYYLDLSYNIQQKLIRSLKEKLNGNYNYIIEDYIVNYRQGVKRHYKIDNLEKIDLKIINANN